MVMVYVYDDDDDHHWRGVYIYFKKERKDRNKNFIHDINNYEKKS